MGALREGEPWRRPQLHSGPEALGRLALSSARLWAGTPLLWYSSHSFAPYFSVLSEDGVSCL